MVARLPLQSLTHARVAVLLLIKIIVSEAVLQRQIILSVLH